ncbi:hypothetical protein QTP70_028183 [Hemibagrus guttatus]|uniref:Uncharacterized protein n=1 Tax=Hemibagrus guttatus TaxID=175788 RepID=A0AAE0PUM4_9TELE|nr:hypothetical protein QTP70_028183 [Hemibagrus guttatus]
MEHLPQTKGKGVLMFARRRQRIDEIAAEHEDLRSKGIPVEAFVEPEIDASSKPQVDIPPFQQNEQVKHQLKYQDHQTQQQIFLQPDTGINGLDSCQDSSTSKPLVSNRTAKPFLSGLNQSPAQFSPVRNVPSPTIIKSENVFKVPVPVNTCPQVWSPTGDIIASRDERIAVPAIKSVILPEMKKRGKNKTNSNEPPEEDYFSLGAEACNFMQAPTLRQKQPPPVLPKPTINPHCPPWSPEDNAAHSPLTPSSPLPVQQNWSPPRPPQSQPATKPWAPSPAQPMQQQHVSDYLPTKPSASYKPAWSSEPQQPLTSASPLQPRFPRAKLQSTSSVVSCPPQQGRSFVRLSKVPPVSSISEIGSSDGTVPKGKGAELFARRQSRMEKFIIDDETVQANIARTPSPTLSMPSTWKYSSNVRAPPPVSYNPIVSPFYPPAAQKQSLPAASSNMKPKGNKEKPKTTPKTLSVMDVMKHQPYQLDSSLFTYRSNAEAKGPSPKTSPTPPAELKQTQGYLHASSPVPSTGSGQSFQQRAKPSGPVYSRSCSMSLPRRHSSMSTVSSFSSPGFHPSRGLVDRQMSWAEASRSPLCLVSEVSGSENIQNPMSSSFHSAVHRRSVTEEKPVVYEGQLEDVEESDAVILLTLFTFTKHRNRTLEMDRARDGESHLHSLNLVMSRFSTLSAQERKKQAAAICSEIHGTTNGDTMDLGKKLSVPKDIMLEELSLLSNRGSRLFRMRQRRSEKYTFESIQNETNAILNSEDQTNAENAENKTPNTPDARNPANPEDIAPGYGGPLKDLPPERFNATALPKSYHSPWEEAIINDPALAETLKLHMPAPEPRADMPDYKSFNRVATPYGGFEKAPRGITFMVPELDLNPPRYPELQDPTAKRPTFNRTAQGWISDGVPLILPTIPVEPLEIPESDDL